MENFKIVYVNAEIKTLYVGLQEGKSFVNLYWNSGIDTSLEKEVEMQVITIGVDNGKDIEFLEFLNINNEEKTLVFQIGYVENEEDKKFIAPSVINKEKAYRYCKYR